MAMAVMKVRVVGMLVRDGLMSVRVAMRLSRGIARAVRMLVMGVMYMAVSVLQRLVGMGMLMPLGQMKV
jgi:hypothetical protein